MKANEAPEKIYLNKHPFTGELHDKWLRNKWDDSDVEYTRTDAFIKKARKYFIKELPNFRSFMESGTAFIKNFESFIQGE